jgi:uncharacterized membrane protein AbrB (regulator of aidB expression)
MIKIMSKLLATFILLVWLFEGVSASTSVLNSLSDAVVSIDVLALATVFMSIILCYFVWKKEIARVITSIVDLINGS